MLRPFDSIHLVSTNGSSRLQRPRAYFCLLYPISIPKNLCDLGTHPMYLSHAFISEQLFTEYHILPTMHSHVTILIVVSPSVRSFVWAFTVPFTVKTDMISLFSRLRSNQLITVQSYPLISIHIHSFQYPYHWLDLSRRKEQQNRYNAVMSSCFGFGQLIFTCMPRTHIQTSHMNPYLRGICDYGH